MKTIRQILSAASLVFALGAASGHAEAGARKPVAGKQSRAPISTRATDLLGARLKQRIKTTGHQRGRLKLNLSEIASIPDAELDAAEPAFARAGIELSDRSTVVHVDGSGPPQATWYYRVHDQRAKPGAIKPSAKTLRRLSRPMVAKTYTDFKSYIEQQGVAIGEFYVHVGRDAERGMDTMAFIDDQIAPLLAQDNIRVSTVLVEAATKAVRVTFRVMSP